MLKSTLTLIAVKDVKVNNKYIIECKDTCDKYHMKLVFNVFQLFLFEFTLLIQIEIISYLPLKWIEQVRRWCLGV